MAARTRRARVTGIGGIFFRAKDPKAMVQWYRRHLGIAIEDTMALFAWKGGKDGKVRGHTVWLIFPADTKYFGEDGAAFMINYRVKDLKGVLAALGREGVDVDPKVEDTDYGRFAWITDHGASALFVVRVGSVQRVDRIPFPGEPHHVTITAQGTVAVADHEHGRLLLYDAVTRRRLGGVRVGAGPHGVWATR